MVDGDDPLYLKFSGLAHTGHHILVYVLSGIVSKIPRSIGQILEVNLYSQHHKIRAKKLTCFTVQKYFVILNQMLERKSVEDQGSHGGAERYRNDIGRLQSGHR